MRSSPSSTGERARMTRWSICCKRCSTSAALVIPGGITSVSTRVGSIIGSICSEGSARPWVASQKSQRFRWLIYVDPYTPTKAIGAIEALLTDVDHELVAIDSAEDADKEVARRVGDSSVITTKLDNDDALDRSHIESGPERVRDAGAGSVLFTSGAVVFVESGRAYRLLQRHSPFYSLVAEPGGVTAVSVSQGDLDALPSANHGIADGVPACDPRPKHFGHYWSDRWSRIAGGDISTVRG